jgi:hypothetical protein
MAKGFIKSVVPQMIGDVHKSWTNKFNGNLNYGFIITFEDGTTGSCGSEKTTYPLPVGTEVTYELATSTSGRNNITKISKVMPNGIPNPGANGNGNGNGNGKSTYNDPDTVKRIAFSMCQSIARVFFSMTGRKPRSLDDINGLAAIFYSWVLESTHEADPHFRDLVSRKYYALQLAAECISFPNMGIATKENLMEAADILLEPVMAFGDEPQF